MSVTAISGANGFLGWHTRCAARSFGFNSQPVKLGDHYVKTKVVKELEGVDSVVHIAGVNRGSETEVYNGNIKLAEQLCESILACKAPPKKLVFANSIQSNNGSTYGESKLRASEILASAAEKLEIPYFDVHIPNVFGEHGKPFYNAVTSTFCYQIAVGQVPEVREDKQLLLIHAQDVADFLLGHTSKVEFEQAQASIGVAALRDLIVDQAEEYSRGDIPKISNPFERNIFNTYRSYSFEHRPEITLKRNKDNRGTFYEIIRSHGGEGQFSFSTTVPGITRGNHFHRRKIERFSVLFGQGVIRMRKLFTNQVVEFYVDGDSPTAIDMPTMWSHNISNTGETDLLTSFWISEIFDPENPDTVPESVDNWS